MSQPLRAVPGPVPNPLTPVRGQLGYAQPSGPIDRVGARRLRRAVITHLGDVPDIEGWLAAGPPANSRNAGTWIEALGARFPSLPVGSLPAPAITRPVGDVHHVDVIVQNWPAGGLPGFNHAYATVEATLDEHGLTIPPIDS